MIRWDCNFNITDSTIQLSHAMIEVPQYKNVNGRSKVDVIITDESKEVVIRSYTREFDRTFANMDEVYEELVKDFSDAAIIA